MQKTEQRAFAAVSPVGEVAVHTIRPTAERAVNAAQFWRIDFTTGWRIRPVIILVEDENEGVSNDK